MWPFFATTAAYAMNTFASEALSGFSPFQPVSYETHQTLQVSHFQRLIPSQLIIMNIIIYY